MPIHFVGANWTAASAAFGQTSDLMPFLVVPLKTGGEATIWKITLPAAPCRNAPA